MVMMTTFALPKQIALRARMGALAALSTSSLFIFSVALGSEQESHGALNLQRKALCEAVTQRDATAVAKLFTADAMLMLPGFETIIGREAIDKFWQAGLRGGMVKGIAFTPADICGEGDSLLAETGILSTLDAEGKEMDQSRYLLVWKREEGEWRIHRDMANPGTPPSPRADRVGFPKDYRTTFKILGGSARTNISPSLVMTAYGNDLAASVTSVAQLPYPNGSIILMEFAEALRDSDGKISFDEKGQPRRGKVDHVDVMRRGDGFGEAYGLNRSGHWEFAGYRLDGTYSTAPAKSASCAQCHQKAGSTKDFVFPLKTVGEATKEE